MDAIRLEQHLAAESYASRRCLGMRDSAKKTALEFRRHECKWLGLLRCVVKV